MEFFYGWIIVVLCTMCKILKSPGQNNIMTYSIPHLLEDFEMSHSELSTCFSLATVSASFFQPFLGRCVDHAGARVCIPAAQLMLALNLLCFSLAPQVSSVPLRYAMIVVLFLFLRGLTLGACETFPNQCIQQWFVQRRGRVMAVVSMSQQVANGLSGLAIAALVAGPGWRFAMRCGALGNIAMVLPGVLLLRKRPEDCGLLPDGIRQVPTSSVPIKQVDVAEDQSDAKTVQETEVETSEEIPTALPSGLFPLYAFTFFYAVIFGGCDFEMVYIFEEAAGGSDVNVADHVFFPMALTIACGQPVIGELVDRCKKCNRGVTCELLTICGFFTCLCTAILPWLSLPALAVCYAILRGGTGAIFGILLGSGLAFAEFGVHRALIGRALGLNSSATLAGTALGPLLYGVGYDYFGSFRGTLILTSIPPLLLCFYFGCHAVRWNQLHGPEQKTSTQYKKVDEKQTIKKAAQVMGRLTWEPVPSCVADDSRLGLEEEDAAQEA